MRQQGSRGPSVPAARLPCADLPVAFLYLPAMIFESAVAMEVHLFRRMLTQITLLAVPRLIIATLLTALLVRLALSVARPPLHYPTHLMLAFKSLVDSGRNKSRLIL